ncbi:GGDEF domain-containing protein [Candidatus Methylobacter oryzae]|uniref:diguanylate cyclase n=1 Tax=Candidatus Methylobacter oryzae TaxID=2497749 RepID=A0ABY3C5A8_9GAMM|nr:GGDEF domain-containing protein [Candidatus Methylobacter oryzae]TRW89657.1 GGDEF domain-containing protein [Candidatus Methylobacter oryzae]
MTDDFNTNTPPALISLTKSYICGLQFLFAFTPGIAITYLYAFPPSDAQYMNFSLHHLAIGVSTLISSFVTWVTWLCYRSSGEIFLRWLAFGFLGFSIIYACHGLFTQLSNCNLGLFLIYGPVSRLVLALCLLLGLLNYNRPADSLQVTAQLKSWRTLFLLFIVLDLLIVLAFSRSGSFCLAEIGMTNSNEFASKLRRGLEWGVVATTLINIFSMLARRIRGPLMTLFMISLVVFAQASISFLLAKPWNHQWWLAHAIFASGFLLLSYGIMQAFLSSRSFARVYSVEELMAHLRDANLELVRLANTDPLTNIANRRSLMDSLAIAIDQYHRYACRFSVLILDLDHFKQINDTYGHAAGDWVLQETVSRSFAQLRSMDVLGRIGGEEFAVLLPHTGTEEAIHIAERLRATLAETPIIFDGQTIPVTMSIGVAEYSSDHGNGESLLRQADFCLYEAKRRGRNRVESDIDTSDSPTSSVALT